MRFPLSSATNFLLQLKTAAEVYAPPDTTGELEGAFAGSPDEVVQACLSLLENELKTGYAYQAYANMLRDLSHFAVAEEFEEHAADEGEHADFLLRRLSVLSGAPPLPDIPAPPSFSDPNQIMLTMVRMEQEGIAKWRLLKTLVGEENPMRFKIEEYLTKEQEHLDQLWQMLPPEQKAALKASPSPSPAPAPSAPSPSPSPALEVPTKTAAAKRTHDDKIRGPVSRAPVADDPSRNIPEDFSRQVEMLSENPDAFSQTVPTWSGWDFQEGTHGQSSEDLRKNLSVASKAQLVGDVLKGLPVGIAAGGLAPFVQALRGKDPRFAQVAGPLAGAALATGHAYKKYRDRRIQGEQEQDIAAPLADPGERFRMDRLSDRSLARAAIHGGLQGVGVGISAMPFFTPAARIGAGSMALGDFLSENAKNFQANHRDILEGRAHAHANKILRAHGEAQPPLEVPTKTAGLDDTPAVPLALSPTSSGSLARLAGQPSNDGSPGVPAAIEEEDTNTGLPDIPLGVDPGNMDPDLLGQLQREEEGRTQESEAAAQYYSEQAQASTQQAQQLQQQLEQMGQEVQQLQQQLQNEQAQKQQAQQMAQQASDTATQSLGQQLQMQQQALMSRQQTTQVLTQHDNLRQQLREVIDPPPAPPAGMPGAPQQDPSQGQAAPPPAQGQSPAEKTASLRDIARAATHGISDFREGGPRQAIVRTGVPVAAGLIAGVSMLRQDPAKKQEAVDAGRKALEEAETAYGQKRNYANAIRVLKAKGGLAAAEVNQEYPHAAALAAATTAYGTTRGVTTGLDRIATRIQNHRANINDPLIKNPRTPGATP